ncbi:MAG: ABC transporter substrate-binding protein [Actinobacteria bacterium]|nr:ABC transporter substrate-binding protein [Actinomycetota bacterium]MBO0784890.1 ABC transporter substrate-binding protein [Actinomycetota bacterium]
MTHRKSAAWSLIAVSGLVVLAACGGSGGGTGGGQSGAPVHGGNLVIARTADSQSMNATTVFDNESIWIFEQIMQPLYTVTPNGKGTMPWLATGYKVSSDKKTYTFTLRPGVKFSTGKPMTSADVKFSLDQARAASKGWGYIDTAIKSVSAPAPETVVVHLKYPWAPLLADLSLFANGIVPDHYGGQTENQFYQHPVGTGPFKWDYWHKGSALKLVRNPYFWQHGKPYLNSVTWTDVPSDNTRELQLKGGQAQIDEFPAWSTVNSLKSTPNVVMHLFPSTRTDYLTFNEKVKPFNDVHVRRAISLAINRAALVKAVLFGNGKPANSLFPPQVPYYQPATKGLQYNLAAAKQEMAKSSVPHGFTTTILVSSGFSDDKTVATILQSELKPLGITLKIQQLDPNTVNNNQQNLKYDVTQSYWTMDIPDPDELATFAVDPKSGAKSFFTAYDNPKVVKDTHQAEQTLATSARQSLYNYIQSQSAADAFMAFLYYSPYAYATSSRVHGFYVTPLGNYHLENVWLSK